MEHPAALGAAVSPNRAKLPFGWCIAVNRDLRRSHGGPMPRARTSVSHPARAHVGVLVLFERGADQLVGDAALGVLADLAQIVVLHREVVGAVLEFAAQGLEAGILSAFSTASRSSILPPTSRTAASIAIRVS